MGENEKPLDNICVLKELTRIAERKFSDEMAWINDIERKASTLIGINGVILALTVPLLKFIYDLLWDRGIKSTVLVFPTSFLLYICLGLYFISILILGISIYFAYHAQKIEIYSALNVNDLINARKNDVNISLEFIYKREISDYEKSFENLSENREKKANDVSKSQVSFFIGLLVLISILLVSVFCTFGVVQ